MKTIIKELPAYYDAVEIIPMGDLHLGDKNCDLELIKKRVEEISHKIGTYVILTGDLINNAIANSKSDIYSEEISPMEQINRVVQIFKPIHDKIIAICSGNHERRTYKETGIDIMYMIAVHLGLTSVYSSENAVIFVRFGKDRPTYSIYVMHGSGGGKKAASKIRTLNEMGSVIDADIFIHSHTHLPATFREAYYRTSPQHCSVNLVDKLYVNTGATLNYGGYAEINGYTPASKETPYIYLNGKKREFKVKL